MKRSIALLTIVALFSLHAAPVVAMTMESSSLELVDGKSKKNKKKKKSKKKAECCSEDMSTQSCCSDKSKKKKEKNK